MKKDQGNVMFSKAQGDFLSPVLSLTSVQLYL